MGATFGNQKWFLSDKRNMNEFSRIYEKCKIYTMVIQSCDFSFTPYIYIDYGFIFFQLPFAESMTFTKRERTSWLEVWSEYSRYIPSSD